MHMNTEAKTFVLLLILLSADAGGQPEQSDTEQEVEVVEVVGKRLQELRFQIEDARLDIYDIFNSLNTDDEFDVHCEGRKETGSLIKHTICEPAFVSMLLENTARTAFLDRNANGRPGSSSIAPLVQGGIAQKNLQLRDKMVELANKDAELQSAILDLQELMAEYAEATGE